MAPAQATTLDAPAADAEGADIAVALSGLRKSFGDVTAVDDLDLDIRRGEFFSMLGPSGSGKTTVLRLIAGFEQPTAGTIRLDDVDVTRAAPFDRNVNTVFQDYALFPHMTIDQNVAYGLTVRRVPKAEQQRQVAAALEQVRLGHVGGRRPSQLSGGQRQRIALARALILRPKVLLLDEPLGALDKQLREEMQVELKQIQREVGITFIFVTHDQEEAMTLSDRVAVFNQGKVEQVGPPAELYERPATEFVAGFLGVSNLIPRTVAAELLGIDQLLSIRPERIALADRDSAAPVGDVSFTGTVTEAVYTGAATKFFVAVTPELQLICNRQNTDAASAERFRRGDEVRVSWHPTDAYLVPDT